MATNVNLSMIHETISRFEVHVEPFDEYNVVSSLNTLTKENPKLNFNPEVSWEIMAFVFRDNDFERNGSDDYFKPYYTGQRDSGERYEYPDSSEITEDCYKYWQERAVTVKHPVLKYRYSMLCWEFGKKVREFEANPAMAKLAIDSCITIAEKKLYSDIYTFPKLIQTLKVAKEINNEGSIKRVKDVFLIFEDEISEDSKPGLWGYSYDIFIATKSNNDLIDEATELAIISSLEDRFSRLIKANDSWSAEHAALRLAKYYSKKNNKDEIARVLKKYGMCVLEMVDKGSGLQQASWLQILRNIYKKFSLEEEADLIAIRLQSVGEKINSEMKTAELEVKLPHDYKERNRIFLDEIMSNNPTEALKRIAKHYIIRKSQTEVSVNENKDKFIHWHIATTDIFDHKGLSIARLGTIDNDFDGHVINGMSEHLNIYITFLREVMETFFSKYPDFGVNEILEYLYLSPVYDESKKNIIKKGLEAYLNKNYMTSIHLLIPQIEGSIRNFAQLVGCSIIKSNRRRDGYQYKNFDELLREDRIIQILGVDYVTYFKVLFTDKRGWNIRNNICHGIFPAEGFNYSVADRVFHSLLCLALIKPTKNSSKTKESS